MQFNKQTKKLKIAYDYVFENFGIFDWPATFFSKISELKKKSKFSPNKRLDRNNVKSYFFIIIKLNRFQTIGQS